MLFNATQAEELRVAIVDGQKLIDLDIESAAKEQRKSNIYKGVITRIEPSLEACFVNYGEERHGFLPFKEVSRTYFAPGVDVGRAKISEALREGQELLVQVDKDERGNKGAALTTYISLAGRYLVLMPNNPRGGGVSRRVEGDERSELRDVIDQLQVPNGMSLIARTAAIGRSVEELQWDMNYLMQLWGAIEGAAGQQAGPFLIYLEGSLVIRAIRDYFHAEIGEILIDTEDVYEQARAFMGTVMPNNINRVKLYRDDVPLFSRFQIEHQIESAYSRQVTLPSGGAVVIDHTEALVAVDVNSGRSTKGSDIEETALRTNLEAADELARQLRLRDLGGLIVIDFIDMESTKNQREVENRLRDALRYDRARVQMGKISRFGLMELSRQRLRPALAETSYITCPRCTGTGHIRSTESAALHILRILEEEAMKDNTGAVHAQVPVDVATFLLNEKRPDVATIELRHKVNILLIPNIHLETPQHTIERLRHDDLNAEDRTQPSYKMAVEPEAAAKQPSAAAEAGKPRQEAAIKQFTPDQPAPMAVEKPAEPAAQSAPEKKSGGLFSRIVGWFRSSDAPASEPKPEATTGERKERGTSERRDGRRGERGRNGERGERTERGDRNRGERGERGGRNDNRGGQDKGDGQQRGRNQQGRREPGAENRPEVTGEDKRQDGRPPRGRGGERGERPERSERGDRPEKGERSERPEGRRERPPMAGQAADAAQVTEPGKLVEVPDNAVAAMGQESAAPQPNEGQEGGRGRRGRRGRRGGERRPEGANQADLGGDSSNLVGADAVPLSVTESPADTPAFVPPVEPVRAAETVVPQAADVEAPAQVAAAPIPAAPSAAPTPAPVPPRAAEPVAVPTPATPVVSIDELLKSSGLMLVETRPEQVAAAQQVAVESPAEAPRRRTRPAPVVVADEPLQQVETRSGS
jgi:ribonuclease E